MPGSNNNSLHPYLDIAERVRPTVPMLVSKCDAFASSDERFRNKKRFEYSDNASWMNPDTNIQWLVGFTALHSYEDIVKPVKSYRIGLAVTTILKRAPKELRKHVIDSDYKLLSDEDNIKSIVYSHVADFKVNKEHTLDWSIHRAYTINYTDRVKGLEQVPTTFSYLVEQFPSPILSREMIARDKADDSKKILAGAFTEVHVYQAAKLLDMLDAEHEQDYDLSTVFPLDVFEGNY